MATEAILTSRLLAGWSYSNPMYLTATQAESNEQEKHRYDTIEMPVSALQQQQAEPPSSCVLAVGSWQPDSLVTFAIGLVRPR